MGLMVIAAALGWRPAPGQHHEHARRAPRQPSVDGFDPPLADRSLHDIAVRRRRSLRYLIRILSAAGYLQFAIDTIHRFADGTLLSVDIEHVRPDESIHFHCIGVLQVWVACLSTACNVRRASGILKSLPP